MPKLIVAQIEKYVKLIFAEMKAWATGDRLLFKKVEIESNLNRFYALRTQYNTEYGRLKHELSQLPARIIHLRQVVKRYE